MLIPRFTPNRLSAIAALRCSGAAALLSADMVAGRVASAMSAHTNTSSTTTPNECASGITMRITPVSASEARITVKGPSRSQSLPAMGPVTIPPSPYALTASPASAADVPMCLVR